jgi:hypothetical protein
MILGDRLASALTEAHLDFQKLIPGQMRRCVAPEVTAACKLKLLSSAGRRTCGPTRAYS